MLILNQRRRTPRNGLVGMRNHKAGKKTGRSRGALIGDLLRKLEYKLESEDFKATLSDYIKLLQLEKELAADQIKEIKVTWIDPQETEQRTEE